MRKRRFLFMGILIAATVGAVGLTGFVIDKNKMSSKTFAFEIGKTLQETAAQTRFSLSGQSSYGLISASSPSFPKSVYGTYAKPGFEITAGPLTWIMFYADTHRYSNKTVNIATLSIDASQGLDTHAKVYDYVYALAEQFRKKNWQRYFDEECPRLWGKESLIDDAAVAALVSPELKGYVGFGCSIDPAYKPSLEEWKKMADDGFHYTWHDGQGNVARLDVRVSEADENGKLEGWDSDITLEFELEDSIKKRAAVNREYDIKDQWGDRFLKVEAEKRRIRTILEKRAVNKTGASSSSPLPLTAKAGTPCPQRGRWESMGSVVKTRTYEEGELMADLGSSYGLTIWRRIE